MFYCNACHHFYDERRHENIDGTCPDYFCDGEELQTVDDGLVDVIRRLNDDRHFVTTVYYDYNTMFIVFKGFQDFKYLPDDFRIAYLGNQQFEFDADDIYYTIFDKDSVTLTVLYYKDTAKYLKSPERCADILDDLAIWVNTVCRTSF